MSRYTIILAAVIGATATACGRSAGSFAAQSAQPSASAIAVQVTNDNFVAVDLYVVSQGVATRMGTVLPGATEHFVLDPSFIPSGEVRLVATPIGGNGRASSGPLLVSPGETIDFEIGVHLLNSIATVH